MMRLLGCLAATLLWCGSAWGQAKAESPNAKADPASDSAAKAPPPPVPPDVVVLKNGNRYRGTIAELVKGGPVTIVLITGETRKLDGAEVAYAGPSENEPKADDDSTPPDDDSAMDDAKTEDETAGEEPTRARARFSSNKRDTEFLYRTAKGFKRLCVAPCRHDFEPDLYTIGVRFSENEKATRLRDVMIDRTMSLDLEYRSRRGLRRVGAAVAVISAVVLGGAGLYGLFTDDPAPGPVWAGVGLGVPGIVVGLSLASVSDKLILNVVNER